MSFCFGVAAGSSGSRGARAVRARAASFAPQAQAPGRCRGHGRKNGGLTNRRSGDRIKVQKIRLKVRGIIEYDSKINCIKGVEKHEKETMESVDRAHFGGNDVYGRPVFRLQS